MLWLSDVERLFGFGGSAADSDLFESELTEMGSASSSPPSSEDSEEEVES
jgi:hypothetical protein